MKPGVILISIMGISLLLQRKSGLRYLDFYMIEPESINSMHFSAAAGNRGYIHNLPIENQSPL